MEPLRVGPSLPPMVEREDAIATTDVRPKAAAESAIPAAPASSHEARTFQPSVGDEVLIAFESGEQRMAFLTGALWKPETPPTSASAATETTQTKAGEAPAPAHKIK
jgi:phage baseplate assembly protein gpV